MTEPQKPKTVKDPRPISADGWMRVMVGIVIGAVFVAVISGVVGVVASVTAVKAQNSAETAVDAVKDATELLNRRSVVIDTTGCSVRAQANFLDAIGQLVQLDRNNIAERDRLYAALTDSSDQMRKCAPTQAEKVTTIETFVKRQTTKEAMGP